MKAYNKALHKFHCLLYLLYMLTFARRRTVGAVQEEKGSWLTRVHLENSVSPFIYFATPNVCY